MRKLVGVAAGLFALTLTATASATSSGLAGDSGKSSGTCGTCHTGGAAPTVAIDGPDTLAANAQGSYTITVTTSLTSTGIDVAGSQGVALAAGTGDKVMSSEIVQSSPLAATGGSAQYTFTVTAPGFGQSLTLFASGVGANGDGAMGGDGAVAITKTIAVTGGSAAPPTSSETSTSSKKKKSSDDDDDDDDSTASKQTTVANPWNDTQSCAVSRGPSGDATPVVAAAFVALGLVASMRRRRRA